MTEPDNKFPPPTSQEFTTLISIRDPLLPNLLLGDVRVKEAEKVLEAMA